MFGLNKKLLISIALVSVLVLSAVLGFIVIPDAVNRFRPPTDMPVNLGTVSGNGGNAVMVGGYLYFTSGFVSNASDETLTYKQNEYNKVRGEGSIWRVKMPSGTVSYDNSYLEDWDEISKLAIHDQLAQYGNAMNKRVEKDDLKLIVPKIAGWEKAALWIFGNNLIYTSPNNLLNNQGQLQRNHIDFFRTDLRGRNHTKIYTTKSPSVEYGDFTVASIDDKPYLLVHDEDKLVSIDMKGKVKTISTTVRDVIFPYVTSYYDGYEIQNGELIKIDSSANLENSYAGMMSYVYFTETPEEDDTKRGSILSRYKIGSPEPERLWHDASTQHRLMELANGNLIIQLHFASGSPITYAVDEVHSDYSQSGLNRFRLEYELHEEEYEVYISGERTARNAFFYLTKGAGGTLTLVERHGSGWKRTLEISGITNFMSIVEVTRSYILYEDSDGWVRKVNLDGVLLNTPSMPQAPTGASRLSSFFVVDELGTQRPNKTMFFYIKEISQQDGEGYDTTTIAVLVDEDGVEHIIARLDDKFIPPPPENPPARA